MNPLTLRYQQMLAQLRDRTATLVTSQWDTLGNYDQDDIAPFVDAVVPIVGTAQTRAVTLTDAYLARITRGTPIGLAAADLTGAAVRNGTDPATVYGRAFVTVWTALKNGDLWQAAVEAGRARIADAARMDVALSTRAAARAIGQEDDRIVGYQRVPDGDSCEFCDLVSGQRYTTDDLMPLHNNCVVGSAVVWASPPTSSTQSSDLRGSHAATRRWYEGEVVVLETAAGHELTVTPNHPVLTGRGWIDAGLLREADGIVSGDGFDRICGRVPDEEHVPARIEERFRAGAVASLALVPFSTEKFHGDAGKGEVSVVPTDGRLDPWVLTALAQPVQQLFLAGRTGPARRPRLCSAHQALFDGRPTPHGSVRSARPSSTFTWGLRGRAHPVLFRSRPQSHTAPQQITPHGRAADAEALGEGQHRLPVEVSLDRVVQTRRVSHSGHVFNLVTGSGWYAANGIVTHNCGCTVEPIMATERHRFTGVEANDLSIPVSRDGVTAAVREHGELGPVLVNGDDHFTGPDDLEEAA